MYLIKCLSMLSFTVMVCAGIYHYAGDAYNASKLCYIAAGVFVCCMLYIKNLYRIFPKSDVSDRVLDILESTVEAREIILMHHIQHEHQGDLASMRRMKTLELDQHQEVQQIIDMKMQEVRK